MQVLSLFQYWTLWMLKRHPGILYHTVTIYIDTFDHMYRIIRALAMKKTEWMDELYFTMMFVQQKLSTHYAEVTSISSKHGSSPHILDRFRKF
jgi:hypothetical protein